MHLGGQACTSEALESIQKWRLSLVGHVTSDPDSAASNIASGSLHAHATEDRCVLRLARPHRACL